MTNDTTGQNDNATKREPADYDRTDDFRCPRCERQGRVQRNSCRVHEWANAAWVAPQARRSASMDRTPWLKK